MKKRKVFFATFSNFSDIEIFQIIWNKILISESVQTENARICANWTKCAHSQFDYFLKSTFESKSRFEKEKVHIYILKKIWACWSTKKNKLKNRLAIVFSKNYLAGGGVLANKNLQKPKPLEYAQVSVVKWATLYSKNVL